MKKITLFLTLALLSSWAYSSVIIEELFNYEATNLANVPAWTTTGTLTTGTGRNIVTPPLSYANAGGTFILSGEGKAMEANMTSTSAYLSVRSLPSTLNSGVVYLSFLFKAGVIQGQTGAEVFGLGTGTSAGPRIWVGRSAITNQWRFGITRSSTTNADIVWNNQEFTDVDEVVLLVIKYDFATLTASFYINPTLNGTEPVTPAAVDNSRGTGRTSLNNLWFRSTGSTMFRYFVSGARLSTTWASAVAIKSESAVPLPAPTVGSATTIGAESFTAHWTPVANATSYDVRVYRESILQGTFTAQGQETSSVFIRGLLSSTTYTYRVVARGDAVNFTHSVESDASSPFTTLEGLAFIQTNFETDNWGTLFTIDNQPIAGAFPTSIVNGFDLINTFLYDISRVDSRGVTKRNALRMDRQSNNGMIVLPTVNSLQQVEIHAIPGGAPRSFVLRELLNGVWTMIGTYEMTSATDYREFIIPLNRTVPTKLRIENAGTGQITIYQITTRTTNPVLLPIPLVGEPSAISNTGFTANWQPVANASGYRVFVFLGTEIVSTVEVAGQSTEQASITGLLPETSYTYRVLALGDGFNQHADSYLSASSVSFATSATTSFETARDISLQIIGKSIYTSLPGSIEVFNLHGSLLQKSAIEQVLKTNLSTGIYLVRFTSKDGFVLNRKVNIW